jgi:hypothetical protein
MSPVRYELGLYIPEEGIFVAIAMEVSILHIKIPSEAFSSPVLEWENFKCKAHLKFSQH